MIYYKWRNDMNRKIIWLFVTIIFVIVSTRSHAESLVPEGIVIQESFKPGFGVPAGRIDLVQGKGLIIHADKLLGYRIKAGLSIFLGDTIITLEKGRVRLKLNDGSVLTLASKTKLVISRSIYDPVKKNRSSFINMGMGKARFMIRKMSRFKRSDFKVKTKTALIGVRGSDFIIEADDKTTHVTALEKTRLEVISLVLPCEEIKDSGDLSDCEATPVFLEDFEQTIVLSDAFPSEIESMLPDEIEILKKDLTMESESDDLHSFKKSVNLPEKKNILVSDIHIVDPKTIELETLESAVKPGSPIQVKQPGIPDPAPVIDPSDGNLPDFPGTPVKNDR